MKYLPNYSDTIVALATPLGKGAIAVIRLSGNSCLSIANSLLRKKIGEVEVRKSIYSELYSNTTNQVIDQVVAIYYKSPASFTGEDTIEISCHCNPLIIDNIIDQTIQQGARIAEPGEFTFRAFMNGKLDLSQAEAVAKIISARTSQSLSHSMRHLEGRLSERIEGIKRSIINYLSLLEINLDFSDEEIEALPIKKMRSGIIEISNQINKLLNTYSYGKYLQEGIKLLILGKPNVGKSSLLNVLLEKDRAIVSEIPGTTRDYIEANLELDGFIVNAVDTAGIRKTTDRIENIGVKFSIEQLKMSDIALCLFESHLPLDADDAVLKTIIQEHANSVNFIMVLNKVDLGMCKEAEEEIANFEFPNVKISAEQNTGINALKRAIKEQLFSDNSLESEELVITSARHKKSLEDTLESLSDALTAIDLNASEEIIAVDIRLALQHLGEITGETTAEDILNNIFSNFCIGK